MQNFREYDKNKLEQLRETGFFLQLLACVHVFEFLEPNLGEVVLLVLGHKLIRIEMVKKGKVLHIPLLFILFLPVSNVLTRVLQSSGIMVEVAGKC